MNPGGDASILGRRCVHHAAPSCGGARILRGSWSFHTAWSVDGSATGRLVGQSASKVRSHAHAPKRATFDRAVGVPARGRSSPRAQVLRSRCSRGRDSVSRLGMSRCFRRSRCRPAPGQVGHGARERRLRIIAVQTASISSSCHDSPAVAREYYEVHDRRPMCRRVVVELVMDVARGLSSRDRAKSLGGGRSVGRLATCECRPSPPVAPLLPSSAGSRAWPRFQAPNLPNLILAWFIQQGTSWNPTRPTCAAVHPGSRTRCAMFVMAFACDGGRRGSRLRRLTLALGIGATSPSSASCSGILTLHTAPRRTSPV